MDREGFEAFLAGEGVGPHTRRAYVGVVRRWHESGEPDMLAWARARLADMPAGSAGQLRAALRHWRAFHGEPPIAFPRGARARRVARDPLDDGQLAAFYRKVKHTPGLLPGVRVVLELLPRTGLRISEACALRGEHLLRADGGWSVRVHGKGGHARTVPLTEEAHRLLTTYGEAHRSGARFERSAWLFEGATPGERLRPDTVRFQLRGIRGAHAWTPHVLRHTFATRYYHATEDLLALSQILGHRSIETTRIYVQASAHHKREGMERAELRPAKAKNHKNRKSAKKRKRAP